MEKRKEPKGKTKVTQRWEDDNYSTIRFSILAVSSYNTQAYNHKASK